MTSLASKTGVALPSAKRIAIAAREKIRVRMLGCSGVIDCRAKLPSGKRRDPQYPFIIRNKQARPSHGSRAPLKQARLARQCQWIGRHLRAKVVAFELHSRQGAALRRPS